MSKADKFVQDHIEGKPKKKKKNNDVAPDLATVGYKRLKESGVDPKTYVPGTDPGQHKFATKDPVDHEDRGARPNTANNGRHRMVVTGRKVDGALVPEHLDGPATSVAPGRM